MSGQRAGHGELPRRRVVQTVVAATAGALAGSQLTPDAAHAEDYPSYPNGSGSATVVPRPLVHDLRDYGGVADGTTDNVAAFNAAVAAAVTAGGGTVAIASGVWRFNGTLVVPPTVSVAGAGRGITRAGSATALLFAAGVTGISITGNGSSVRDLWVESLDGGATSTADGLALKASRVLVENVAVYRFGRSGIRIDTTDGSNANRATLIHVRVDLCAGDGMYLAGSDANAISVSAADIVRNGGYGIRNISGSKNWFDQIHFASNALGLAFESGNGNTWRIYCESNNTPPMANFEFDGGGTAGGLLEDLSAGYVTLAGAGLTNALVSWTILHRGAYRYGVRVADHAAGSELGATGGKMWALSSGRVGVGALDLVQNTDAIRVLDIDSAATRVKFYKPIMWIGGATDRDGAGSPEGVVAATPGSLFRDTTNGLLYVKSTGTANTGWTALGGGAGALARSDAAELNGYKGATMEPEAACGEPTALVSGTGYGARVRLEVGGSLSELALCLPDGGHGYVAGRNFMAVYALSGERLAVTPDLTHQLNRSPGGVVHFALSTPTKQLTAGESVWLVWLLAAATMPTCARRPPGVDPNCNLTAPGFRWFTNGVRRSALPQSLDPQANRKSDLAFWVSTS